MSDIKIILISIFLIIANMSIAQDFPTNREIYDYEIGDVFHYEYVHSYGEYYPPSVFDSILRIKEVEDKYYSVNNDTVCYQFYCQELIKYFENPQPIYSEYYLTICKSQLDSIREGDTVIENSELYNGRRYVKYTHEYMDGPIEWTDIQKWTVGCGITYNYSSSWDWSIDFIDTYEDKLVYYKKGDEEWGEEQVITSIHEKKLNQGINIYPNPIHDYFSISFNNGLDISGLLRVYNSSGQLVSSIREFTSDDRIEVSYLPVGLYYISLVDENQQVLFKGKFIKI